LAAQAVCLPSESYISEFISPIDPVAIHKVCRFIRETLADRLRELFFEIYSENKSEGNYSISQQHVKQRALKNVCLGYLMEVGNTDIQSVCYQQFKSANNMTDKIAALTAMVNNECSHRDDAIEEFYQQWKHDLLVVDKWLGIQATSRLPGTLDHVVKLTKHESFSLKNPNKIRALIGSFAHGNPSQFHDITGNGYRFITDRILEIDKLNPQIAARLMGVYTLWRKYDEQRQALMKQQLEQIVSEKSLSKDVFEIATKSLGR